MPFYERQPYIQPLYQIVKEVMKGDIRVPRFQRPGTEKTWRPEQRGDLLDSIYRGFPVGAILLWATTRRIRTYDVIGGFRVPPREADERGAQRLLLDGHPRLSTLVQILGPGLVDDLAAEGAVVTRVEAGRADEAEPPERWVFELGDGPKDSRERFVALKPGQDAGATQVPLDILLNRSGRNRWGREAKLSDEQETAVDNLRDRLREYSMPVAVLVADSLKEATESFKRVNSSGTALSDFNMVAALAFDEQHDPEQQFADARAAYLAPIGWDEVSDTDVLRVVAGLDEKTNPAQIEVEDVAGRLDRDHGLIERAFQAVAAATDLLRTCGVLGPDALPYTWQLITLAVHLGRAGAPGRPARFEDAAIPAAQRWFWLTAYGEVFAGVNSAVVDRSLGALRDMLDGGTWTKMLRDVTRQVRPAASFDFRTARSKARALAMARSQDRGAVEGPAHRALTRGVEAMQLLSPRGRRSEWWRLAIVTPERDLVTMRDALKRRASGRPELGDEETLQRLGIEPTDAGLVEELLAARRDRLMAAERAFVEHELKLGLTWA
jgi:hypothetical protein